MKKLIYLILILSISAISQELDNYDHPVYSEINNTTGEAVNNRVGAGRFISRAEAAEKININNGASGTFILGENAQILFDFDNDGDLDFFGWLSNITPVAGAANVSGPGKWIWWPNYYNKNSAPMYYDSEVIWGPRPELNDFNGDGIIDILWQVGNLHEDGIGGYYGGAYPLVLIELSADSITERLIGSPTAPHDVTTGDIDNDGDVDIISGEWIFDNCEHISVPKFLINDGEGNFSESTTNLLESNEFSQNNSCVDMIFTYLGLFDMNNDGNLDLIGAYTSGQEIPDNLEQLYENTGYNPNNLNILYGDGNGNFSYSNGYSIELTIPADASEINVNTTALGGNFIDIDNDGFLDLIMAETFDYSGWGIRIYRNLNGTGLEDITTQVVQDPIQLHSGANGSFSPMKPGDLGISYDLRIIDIDNDGDFDIMPRYTITEDSGSTINAAYWENNDGVFNLKKFNDPISDININTIVEFWFSSPTPVENTYGDISNWDVSSVTNMSQLFYNRTDFNFDLSNWDISNVTNMFMIFHSSGLTTANYDKILNGWSQQAVQSNVELGAGPTINFCNSKDARMSLIENYNWNIVDGGLNCSTLNLNDQNQLDISIYPNPTSDIVYINGNYSQLKVGVFDILGKQLMNKSITNTIDISQLEKGVYILKLSDGSKLTTQRIIKK
ncbi:MAG: VCBS repeat-containing protein [Flavobacteriaceae bacterium]|nr:VCBS repeat-containing protein [Flavobacteriaceae bacterium]